MAQSTSHAAVWTLADLLDALGPVPAARVRSEPAPGTATEDDVLEIHRREGRLYELMDGILVEKAVGFYESYLACLMARLIGNYLEQARRGIVTGSDGMVRLTAGLVRIPDVAFISWERLPGKRIPAEPIPDLAPDLAIEVLSAGNTEQEMRRKLEDYFAAGVRLVWYVDPRARTVTVYTSPEKFTVLGAGAVLEGGEVLPGFRMLLDPFFTQPAPE